MNIFGPWWPKKYENGPKMKFSHEYADIFVTSGHFSDMRLLCESGRLETSGHISNKR